MGAGSRCPSTFLAVSRTVDRRARASSITGPTERRCIGRVREVPVRLFSDGPFARRSSEQVDGSADGWSAIVTGSGPSGGFAGSGDRTSRLGGRGSPGGRAHGLRPSPSVGGTSLHRLQASQPFPLVRVIKVRRAAPREAPPCSRRGGGIWAWWARKVFDSQRAGGYSPLDFPLFGGLCWASWRRSETGEERCMQSLVRGGARGPATDRIRRVKFRETPGAETRAGRMSIGK